MTKVLLLIADFSDQNVRMGSVIVTPSISMPPITTVVYISSWEEFSSVHKKVSGRVDSIVVLAFVGKGTCVSRLHSQPPGHSSACLWPGSRRNKRRWLLGISPKLQLFKVNQNLKAVEEVIANKMRDGVKRQHKSWMDQGHWPNGKVDQCQGIQSSGSE